MRKKIFTLLLLFVGIIGAYADNTLAVKKTFALQGGQSTIDVELNNEDTFVGYSFSVTLPAGINPVTETKKLISAETGELADTEVWKSDMGDRNASTHALRTNIIDNADGTKTVNCVVLSGSSDVISGNSGVLIRLFITATASVGTVGDATVSGAKFSNGNTDFELADVNFTVEVTDKVIIDENSTVLPIAQENVNVLVKRTINKNVWSTICLPFDMTEAQLKDAFGSDVQLALFESFENTESSYTVNFVSSGIADGLYGNYPYLIKVSKDVSNFTVPKVNVSPNEEEAIAEYETGSKPKPVTAGTFTGTLKAGATIPKNYLFISGNKFYVSTGSTTIKGMRGYFWLKGFTITAGAPILNILVDDEPTSIKGLNIDTEDGEYYNLNGMKVVNPTEKGVYIKNGKKVVIK